MIQGELFIIVNINNNCFLLLVTSIPQHPFLMHIREKYLRFLSMNKSAQGIKFRKSVYKEIGTLDSPSSSFTKNISAFEEVTFFFRERLYNIVLNCMVGKNKEVYSYPSKM